MALYYVLLRGWVHFGDSEFWLRSLSAFFGVITVAAIYRVGSRFLSREVGLSAAALFAVHSFSIRYSQEVRSYSLTALLVVLSTYAFLSALESPDRIVRWLAYVLLSALSVYAQLLTVFVVFGQWVLLFFRRVKPLWVATPLLTGAGMGLLIAPMAAVMLLQNKGQLNWVPRPTVGSALEDLLSIVGGETATSWFPTWSMVLLALYLASWTFAVRGLWTKQPNPVSKLSAKNPVLVLAVWLSFPVASMIVISFFKPILYPRFLLMCVPAAVLLACQGLSELRNEIPWGRAASTIGFIAIMVLMLVGTREYYASFAIYGHDWRGVTRYLGSQQQPGDAVIFYNFSGHRAFDYYVARAREAGEGGATPVVLFPLSLDRESVEKRIEPYRRVWFVMHQARATAESDNNTKLIRAALQTRLHLIREREFAGTSETPGESGTIRVALYDVKANPSDK